MIRALFRDIRLKLLALVLALGLWLSVAWEPVVERHLDVPLGIQNVPPGLELAEVPATVAVRVRGASSIVSGLAPGDVMAILDLTGEHPGHRRLFDMFSAGRLRVPFGVEVTRVVPPTVAVALERTGLPRAVPIVPAIEGDPADGFVVGSISTVPPEIEVVGPDRRLAELAEALTEPISIAGASEPVHGTVAVALADPQLRLAGPRSAEVTVDIRPGPVAVTLGDVPVRVGGARQRIASIAPDRVGVGVTGAREAVRGLGPASVEASVDLAGLPPGRYNLPVTVEVPREIGVTHIDPPFVSIVLR